MTRQIYKEEFVAGGVEAMYDLASTHPYNSIVTVVPDLENYDEDIRDKIGPVAVTEDSLNKIAKDDQTLSLYIGQSFLGEIVASVAEDYNPNMEDKPKVFVSEPVVEIELTPTETGYKLEGSVEYKLKY